LDFAENLLTSTSQPILYCVGGLAAFPESTILLAVVFELEFANERIRCVAFMCLSTKLTLSSAASCFHLFHIKFNENVTWDLHARLTAILSPSLSLKSDLTVLSTG
jgi:hypothetical protein